MSGSSGCAWDRELKPVEGWTATPTRLRMLTGQFVRSYIVTACPCYRPVDRQGRDAGKRVSSLDDKTLGRWLAAGCSDDWIALQSGLSRSTVRQYRQRYQRARKREESGEER